MGLDSAMFVIEVENAFGITIPNHISEKMYTVGDMYDFFWKKINEINESKCLTQKVFYKLRNQFREQLKLSEDIQIRPDTLIEDLLPVDDRLVIWDQMRKTSEFSLPDWRVYKPGQKLLFVFKRPLLFTKPIAVITESTMRELTLKVMELNYLKMRRKKFTMFDVEYIINNLLVDKLGLTFNEIGPEKSFVNDLGLN